jgi:type II secretory pathway component PulJ
MISPFWWLPLAEAALAAVGIWRGIVRLGRERQHLHLALARLQEVRPMLAQVKAEIDQTRRAVEDRAPR